MKNNILEQVLKTMRNYDMLQSGDKVLAAVSGGPDSVFLLYALDRLKNKFNIGRLYVCNMDHGLRGAESKEDSLFVKKLSEQFGLEYLHKTVDLKKIKPKALSTEEAARNARYKFFGEAAKKVGANVVATGHTLDDQAETVLMRLIKGSSLKGIVGISPVREGPDLKVIRPLLELEKGAIKKFLDEEGMPYRIDRTNLEPIYFRNVIRKEIIPFLERYNPRLKRSLFNLAEHLREDMEFIREAKSKIKDGRGKIEEGKVVLKLKDLVVQPKALQKEILRDTLERAGGEVKKLTFRHWKELEGFIKHKRRNSCTDLPGGVRVERTEYEVIFYLL